MIASNDQIRADHGDGLAVGRCCVWVVVRSFHADDGTKGGFTVVEVEHVMLCVLVGAEMMELRRLVPGKTVIDGAEVQIAVPWKLTAVEVWRRNSLVRLATTDDMRPLEIKFPGVMRLFQFGAE